MDTINKSKLRWRCHRGMLELDLILMKFLDEAFDTLTHEEQMCFEQLLKEPDPDLYAWLMGFQSVNKKDFVKIVDLIKSVN